MLEGKPAPRRSLGPGPQSTVSMNEAMGNAYLVRHWKGQDSIERVVDERMLVADDEIEALLRCVPIDEVENWRLDSHVSHYASLTNPAVKPDMADYWEAELIDPELSVQPGFQSVSLN